MTGNNPEPTLDDVRAMFPGWEVWTGIAGLCYARRLLSSPPMVARGEDPQDLIDQIRREIARRDLRAGATTHGVEVCPER